MERGGKCAPPADFFCPLERRTCKKFICSTSSCGVHGEKVFFSLKTLSFPQDCDAWEKSHFYALFSWAGERGGLFRVKNCPLSTRERSFPENFCRLSSALGTLLHLWKFFLALRDCCFNGRQPLKCTLVGHRCCASRSMETHRISRWWHGTIGACISRNVGLFWVRMSPTTLKLFVAIVKRSTFWCTIAIKFLMTVNLFYFRHHW